jgi:hypothetical protein
VQFNFRALLGTVPLEAAPYFRRAVELDSSFAMALFHLAIIWMNEENRTEAQRNLALLRSVDSTSIWAQVAILADSILYSGRIPNFTEIFDNISLGALELLIVPLGQMVSPPGMQPASSEALRVFQSRAQTDDDRRLAFRLRMAERLARGRFAGADSLIEQATRNRVPRDEVHRWIALSGFIDLRWDLASEREQLDAVTRLESGATDDAEAAWLAARWYLKNRPDQAASRVRRLRDIEQSSTQPSPLTRSLNRDIEATQLLTNGDTSAALDRWEEATRYYSVAEDFVYGLTASLWPLRLQRVGVLTASQDSSDARLALEIAATFEQMAGLVDQVAWPQILLHEIDAARAAGDMAKANEAYARLNEVLVRDTFSPDAQWLREEASRRLAPRGN